MQIAARTAVYDPNSSPDSTAIGRIVFLAEAADDHSATIIDYRVIDTLLLKFPELQGATIKLDIPVGELPPVTKDGQIIAYFGGKASQFDKDNAAEHYIRLCQESGAV